MRRRYPVGVVAPSPELLGRLDPSASAYLQALRERVVIFDGAMGTNLQLLGLGPDDFGGPELEGCNEWLVETRPDLVAQVTARSSRSAATSSRPTPSARTSVVLAEYGLADRARELTRRAAELACAVRDEFPRPSAPAGSRAPWDRAPSSPRSGTSPTPSSGTPTRSRRSGCSRAASTSC